MQIRDVPDAVHAALSEAARERGQSLTGYLNAELTILAERPAVVRHNAAVARRTQQLVRGDVDREAITAALRETRRAQ